MGCKAPERLITHVYRLAECAGLHGLIDRTIPTPRLLNRLVWWPNSRHVSHFRTQALGTSIELTIAGVTLDWCKNSIGVDHGSIFQKGDRGQQRSDQIDYDYYAQHPEEEGLAAHQEAFVRPLARVLPRLNLLGHTLAAARAEYEAVAAQAEEFWDSYDFGVERSRPMNFDEFCAFACRHPLATLDATYIEHGDADRDQRAQGRFVNDWEIGRIPDVASGSDLYWSECSYFGSKVCVLSAYSMLQVFGQSSANLGAEVIWQYGPIVESGWVNKESFKPGARREETVLVATEGTSDARILKHALDLLQPDITDFFRFIDVNERHPFPGTGNLVKFAEGLIRIDVQNRMIFLFDNDAEGFDAYQRLHRLGMPQNMRAMLLPDLDAFRTFPARGPQGVSACDINGRAAAIECYLDLESPNRPPAQVLWTTHKNEFDVWQGVLEHKETYMRRFMDLTRAGLGKSGYDTFKLEAVLKALLNETISLAGSI